MPDRPNVPIAGERDAGTGDANAGMGDATADTGEAHAGTGDTDAGTGKRDASTGGRTLDGTDTAVPRRLIATAGRVLTSRVTRFAFVAVAVVLGGYAVARQWQEVRAELAELGWLTVAGSLLAVLAGLVATMQVWRVLLGALGSPLTARTAGRIFFLGQLGKYIPGSMWPIVIQMELAQVARVPRSRTATAAILTLVSSLCAGLLAALVALPFLATGAAADFRWAFLAVPVLLGVLHPRVVNAGVGRLLRLARRPPLERPLSLRAVVTATAWALGSWLLFGVQVWALAVHLDASPGRALLLCVGGFAFAWSAGLLVVIAPAGAGVRDVVLVAVLTSVLTPGAATAVALVSRVLMTAGDLVLAGVAAWFARKRLGGPLTTRGPDLTR